MVKTRNGKTNNQESAPAPLPKREVLGGTARSALPRDAAAPDRDALLPAPRDGAPLKSAWPESTGNTFPPVPSPFAPPPTLWAELAETTAPQRSLSTIPKRPDTGPTGSSVEEPGSSDGPMSSGHRELLFSTLGARAAIPARQPAHQADDDEDEPRRGTLTDSTPAFVSASTPRSQPEASPASGKTGGTGSTPDRPDVAVDPTGGTVEPVLPEDGSSGKTETEKSASPDPGAVPGVAPPGKAPEPTGKTTEPVMPTDAKPRDGADPLVLPTSEEPGESPARPVSPATAPVAGTPPGQSDESAAPVPISSEESSEPAGEDDQAFDSTTYSRIRSISRGHWGLASLSSMGILLSTTVLVVVAFTIEQFTSFGGLPNSAALLAQITRTWGRLTTDGFVQPLVIALPVLIALLFPLYIAFSIQSNRSPDHDDQVTNEQVALQQVQEGIILILAGLTGMVITLTIPWLTEHAPILLPLPIGGVLTCGFVIAVRSRSLENDRMHLARSTQQEAALAKANSRATEVRLRRQGKARERGNRKERRRDRNRASRESLIRHVRRQLLTKHSVVVTLVAALSPAPLTWHLARNGAGVWNVLLFHVTAVVWLRFFWGYSFTLMRKDVLAEAMKPGNNRLARLGAWAMRTTFELLTSLVALGVIVLILVRLPGLAELPFIVVCTICWHLVLVVIRWLYQQFSRTGRGIRQLDRRLKLIRLRRAVAELRAGISQPSSRAGAPDRLWL